MCGGGGGGGGGGWGGGTQCVCGLQMWVRTVSPVVSRMQCVCGGGGGHSVCVWVTDVGQDGKSCCV